MRALPSTEPEPGIAATVEKKLRDADRLGDWEGQAALDAARRLERSVMDTGSAYAALQRELRAAMEVALRGVNTPDSAVGRHRDEVAARRAQRAGQAR